MSAFERLDRVSSAEAATPPMTVSSSGRAYQKATDITADPGENSDTGGRPRKAAIRCAPATRATMARGQTTTATPPVDVSATAPPASSATAAYSREGVTRW